MYRTPSYNLNIVSQKIQINNSCYDNNYNVFFKSLQVYDDFDYKKDRDLSEVFVESVAFIVADHFGLDTSSCSFRYILGWANGETKTVLELGSKIQDSANDFIEKLEDFNMQEQELELAA